MAKKNKKEDLKLDVKASKKGGGKKGKGVTVVDFSKEIEGDGNGGRWLKRVPEGDYVFTVSSIKEERSKRNPENKMLTVIFIGKEGRVRKQQLRDRFVLVPQSLFKLRQLLEACGQDVPKRGVTINHKELIGTDVGITLRDGDEYEGKIRSEAGDYMPAEDVVPMGEEPKKSKSKGKKKGKKSKGEDSLEDLDLDGM